MNEMIDQPVTLPGGHAEPSSLVTYGILMRELSFIALSWR
jgi:hypothetical protein